MVDIHSHILPEVDDGPKSWDVCVAMCRAAAADGITHMVAAPHANDRYHYDRPYLEGLLKHLQKLVGDIPKISLGCDFHLSYDNVQDALANPKRYVIDDTRYLLVEFSNYSIPQQMTESFRKLWDDRHRHPPGAQSDSAREPATDSRMGATRLRNPGNRLRAHWFLG